MADAINGVSAAGKPQDLSINWNSCTADEVIDYNEEGQEVPPEILAWAIEMAKAEGADEVTYEMAMAEGENQGSGNAAVDLRTQLDDSGMGLKAQGKIFIAESKQREDLTLESIAQMAPLMDSSQAISEDAQAVGNRATSQLENIKNEISSLKDNPMWFLSSQKRGQVEGLKAVAEALSNGATQEIEGMQGELEEIDALINGGAANSGLAQDFGSETIAIGKELAGAKSQLGTAIGATAGILAGGILGGAVGGFLGGMLSGKKKVGYEAIQQGTSTLTVGNQGADIAKEAADAQGVTLKTVDKEAGEVNGSTNVDEGGTSGENTGEETSKGEEAQKPAATTNENKDIANQDPSEVVTDPNEILKRKERRGIVE